MGEDGSIASSFKKFMTEEEMAAIIAKAGAEPGDVVMIIVRCQRYNDSPDQPWAQLRMALWRRSWISSAKGVYKPLWIIEFPFFECGRGDAGLCVAMHHPFTATSGRVPALPGGRAARAKSVPSAYDMVLNGIELACGSIRITDPELQNRCL